MHTNTCVIYIDIHFFYLVNKDCKNKNSFFGISLKRKIFFIEKNHCSYKKNNEQIWLKKSKRSIIKTDRLT